MYLILVTFWVFVAFCYKNCSLCVYKFVIRNRVEAKDMYIYIWEKYEKRVRVDENRVKRNTMMKKNLISEKLC